ncbi:VCBS domain-containing protein [Catenovulum adriaticum]|uniref:VCBS domain-containing protein n=1 Tax=Catenovulum adriaticum TaxID=2984846 RepID=A0ABY7AQ18_9ALTE|nr:VCBS domain-containing protein [Catenovulum sp. TS8]WAJ71654.1 VCBS domain-containing protein [Catenovulum sp. TS8]
MKKTILALSILTTLSGCEIDNSGAKKLPAVFNAEFVTDVGFDGTRGEGLEVPLTYGHGNASGEIGVTDVNFGEAEIDFTKMPEAQYGTFTMLKFEGTDNYSGEWTYDLDETNPSVQALDGNPTATVTESLTFTSLDGTQDTLDFVIEGVAEEVEPEFRGAFTANVSLKETLGFGRAEIYDENFDESSFQNKGESKYGTFKMNPDGTWEYELNNRHPDLQDLIEPTDSTSETFTVYAKDGTETEFKVNITGAPLNFAANIPSTIDETSVFAIDFLNDGIVKEDLSNGKLLFSVKGTEDLAVSGGFGITCDDWNGNNDGGGDNRRMGHFYVKPDGTFEMRSHEIIPGSSPQDAAADKFAKDDSNKYINENVIFDQMLIPGEWTHFVLTWDMRDGLTYPEMTLSINDEAASSDHLAIPADPNEPFVAQTVAGSRLYNCLDEMRFIVRKNEDEGGLGAMLVDDIKLYTNIDADVKFDTPDFIEEFANSSAGDNVLDADRPHYKAITTDNITIIRDL